MSRWRTANPLTKQRFRSGAKTGAKTPIRQETTTQTADSASVTILEFEKGSANAWRIHVSPERLLFEKIDGSYRHEVLKGATSGVIEWAGIHGAGPFIVCYFPKRIVFKLDGYQVGVLAEWLGLPSRADRQASLRRHMGPFFVIGIIIAIFALPLGDTPINYINLGMGLVLIAAGGLGRYSHRPEAFLIGAVWCGVAAVQNTYYVFHGYSALWLLASVACGVMSYLYWTYYRHYRVVREDHAT